MKLLSRILTICLCSAPVFDFAAHAVVATTSGHNLTAYNPSGSNNNQWAVLTNVRDNSGQPTARADFGNCNALIMRCATPKCANGGCVDSNVAAAIVAGCVQSNDTCAQYGNELISYMTAQLVANSTAKVNAQKAAADAAAAARSAQSDQTAQQIAQMQSTMQQQMAQMQRQMEQQNEAAQQRLEDALAAQREQNVQTYTAPIVNADTGITSTQQAAIDRGVSNDVLMRQQITGQIMTQIEDAEVSLKATRTAMQNSFEYAGCDARGNNCSGPKRVKKWRELASDFLEPYDNTIDKIYDALITAQTVGVDLTQIYAMLDGSCNSWAQYMCPGIGAGYYVTYGYHDSKNDNEYVPAAPRVCKGTTAGRLETAITDQNWNSCKPCTWLKPVTEDDEIYEGWMDIEIEAKENQRVIACQSSALDSSKLFGRRTRNKKGTGVIDINVLERWLQQVEPNDSTEPGNNIVFCYSDKDKDKNTLQSAKSGSSVSQKNLCVDHELNGGKIREKNLDNNSDDDYCPYIKGTYAICDTHPYNAGIKRIEKSTSGTNRTEIEEMREIVGLKVTVLSQQMYKQYEYLNATLRRLKTQLEKSILISNLEAAGGKSEDNTSSYGTSGNDKAIHLAGAENCKNKMDYESVYQCVQSNAALILNSLDTNRTKACKQLGETVEAFNTWSDTNKLNDDKCKGDTISCTKVDIRKCAQDLLQKVAKERADTKNKNQGGYYLVKSE